MSTVARSEVRTHAEITPTDLKSVALTTRPFLQCYDRFAVGGDHIDSNNDI